MVLFPFFFKHIFIPKGIHICQRIFCFIWNNGEVLAIYLARGCKKAQNRHILNICEVAVLCFLTQSNKKYS